ncbi:type I polyketide synthase [Amycolatopsis albispora]|uniref:Polyketide synthase n=1 Tax=Amycolatopsis albispora TaxID=1804986 RepID=A0A344L5G9_9PSEU|nr:type I polyketide synthase [Amycolatopsis albispora]AXB43293.1 hypothetical protein A4R43_12625 [Amycolatopsis albispora]
MTASEARGAVRAWIVDWVARRLEIPAHAVSTLRPLDEHGLNSTDIVALTGELGEHLGVPVAPDAVFEYPTVALLADHVSQVVGAAGPVAAEPAPERVPESEDPIAVVGLGCRFPGGVRGARAFWELLDEGRDGIRRVPDGRWDPYTTGDPEVAAAVEGAAGTGGFLEDVAGFDAAFFGISPREAVAMDPQQRLVLEVAWEALEHGGIPPRSLADSRAGVFMAASAMEYLPDDIASVDGWATTGSSLGVIANRLSYTLGSRGPSMLVDTACSGSLVAIHLACRHLAGGDCDLAVAGGVNLLLTPGVSVGFGKSGVLSSDGRCHTFDESADGYSRGEGVGVVVLKRLSDARRDGDEVLAVVRGTAVNANGQSNGLMAPHPGAQEELLRTTYRNAAVDPLTIDFVETHGTGTALGDPIEVGALASVLAPGRPDDQPVLLGAVKTNLGHLEAAAGVAGFIKTVLALRHGRIPANLNFETANPRLGLDTRPLRVVTEPTPWPERGHVRRAAVSSFGFGGTNAHAVLEAAPEPAGRVRPRRDRGADTPVALLSASSADGLRAEAAALLDWLDGPGAGVRVTDIAHTLSLRRSHGSVRAGLLAPDHGGLTAALAGVADGTHHESVVTGVVREGPAPVFVFSGQGSQWPGMARDLLDRDQDFTEVIDELEPLVRELAGFSLRTVLSSAGEAELFGVDVVQPVLFAVQVALAAAWRARGVLPAAVIGHSMGEVAAAVVSGALSARDGARITCVRSGLLRRISGRGRMSVVTAGEAVVRSWIDDEGLDGQVSVAVVLSPGSTVVSGSGIAVERLAKAAEAAGAEAMPIQVDVASHSAQVDELLDEVASRLRGVPAGAPQIPFYSTVTGEPLETAMDEQYWVSNLRRPVRLTAAVAAAAAAGHSVFLEVSPHPVLTRPLLDTLRDKDVPEPVVLPTLHRERTGAGALALSAAWLHCLGQEIAWSGAWTTGELIELPPRRWDHKPYWRAPSPGPAVLPAGAHPLLGSRIDLADAAGTRVWQHALVPAAQPWAAEHEVAGTALLPAAALVEMAAAAAAELGFPAPVVHDLVLHQPVPAGEPAELQTLCRRDPGAAAATVQIHYRRSGTTDWVQCASGRVHSERPGEAVETRGTPENPELTEFPVPRWYDDMAAKGIRFGPRLRGVRTLRAGDGIAEVELAPPDGAAADPRFRLSPVPLNGALQAIGAALPAGSAPMVVSGVGQVRALTSVPATRAVVRVTAGHRGLVADLDLWAGAEPVASLSGVRLTPVPGTAGPEEPDARWWHEFTWRAEPLTGRTAAGERWLLLGGDQALAAGLHRHGVQCRLLGTDADLGPALTGVDRVVLLAGPDGDEPATAVRLAAEAVTVIQRLARAGAAAPRLHFVTRRAQVLGGEAAVNAAQAVWWGLGRSAALEHPEFWGGLVDLDEDDPAGVATRLAAELAAAPPGAQSAYRDGERRTPVLRPVAAPPRERVAEAADGCQLVVGGTGRLGPHLLGELAARGARCLVVLSRRGLRGEALRRAEELRAEGITVVDFTADVADREALAPLFARFGADLPPLRRIYHAAFAESVETLAELAEPALARMFRTKVDGLVTLHGLAGAAEIVCLSSTTGLLGSAGLAHYAAASCFADTYAMAHSAAGGALRVVNLGPCADGLAGTGHEEVILASGLRLMPGRHAVAGLGQVPAVGGRQYVLADADWAAVDQSFALAVRTPVLAELAGAGPSTVDATVKPATVDSAGALAELATAGDRRRREILREHLRILVAEAMGTEPAALNLQQNLFMLGMDSLMSLAVIRAVAATLGYQLAATVLQENPTVAALADHLAGQRLLTGHAEGDPQWEK